MINTNNKLFNLIGSFSDAEIKEFKKLLASPLFTNGRNYHPLLNEILKIINKKLSKFPATELYNKLYPGKKYSSQTLKNRFSEMFGLCEDYLIYKNVYNDKTGTDRILLQYYLDTRLFKLFDSKYEKSRKYVEVMPDNDDKFKNLAFLNKINLNLLNKKNKIHKMYRQFYDNSIYNTCLFLIELFQMGIEFKLMEYDNVKHEFNLVLEIISKLELEDIIKSTKRNSSVITKVMSMYYYLYKAFENPEDEKSYFESKRIFEENISFFSKDYKDGFYQQMISYCIIRQNSGIRKFQLELFGLYNEKLEQGLYSEFKVNLFPVNTFRDFVFIGLAIKKYKWVEDFIKKYSHELPEEIREDEVNLSNAKLHFSERHFEKAVNLLNKVKGGNYIHYNDTAVLKLCCYYELDRIEESYFQLDKFKHYLRNHKEIPKVHLNPVKNFISVYQKIINLKSRPGKSDTGFLENEIRSFNKIAKRGWLLNKIID
ncbi:MAG: hypothetical protein JNJ56_13525 [Ignavibacteria bacterium]|nr:hypothetical protein [Ignavibacteria bacterium]